MAMMMIANRSSTTARVSRNVRSGAGRCVEITARTASAKAMSVAVGIAQPRGTGAAGERQVEHRRHDHAADGRGDRHDGALGVAQVAGDELPLQLEPGDEEEDRQEPVGGPRTEGEVRCSAAGPTTVSRKAK